MNKSISRRSFLKKVSTSAVGAMGIPYIIHSGVLGKAGGMAPSNRVVLGCIGVGDRGALNTRSLMSYGGQVAAVCDVNQNRRLRMKQEVEDFYAKKADQSSYKGCAAYNDFREVLARSDIDAVMIATPDHWHVPIAMEAVKAGKDIYVEKPLGMTIGQGRTLRETVKRYEAVFQHGTEHRAMGHFRYVCELIRNGRIGRLETIKVGCPGGESTGNHQGETAPVGFDYEMWLGPACWREFTTRCCLRLGHYFITHFAASGFIAGWGIHYMDIVQWALDADQSGPAEIDGRAVFPRDGLFDTPLTWRIDYLYGNGVRVNFTDQGQNRHGIRFEGTDGWIQIARDGIEGAEPQSMLRSVIGPEEIHLFMAVSDDQNFLEAVRTRGQTCSPIDAAHRSTTICFLGNISCLLKRKLRWDPGTEQFVDDEEANRMLTSSLRSPWRV